LNPIFFLNDSKNGKTHNSKRHQPGGGQTPARTRGRSFGDFLVQASVRAIYGLSGSIM
jgi:hypothetical protein